MEKWAKQTQRDMDYIKMSVQRGSAPPEIIWESRHIEAIKCNSEISTDEIEIVVVKVRAYIFSM